MVRQGLAALAMFALGSAAGALPLTTQAGDYIEGRLDSGSARVDLDLLDAKGQPVRRLLSQARGGSQFRFVAESAGPMSLRVSGGPADLAPELLVQLPLTQQRAPVATYRSPLIAALAAAPQQAEALAAFWQRAGAQGTPLVEAIPGVSDRVLMTFVWRGAARNVRLIGGPSNDHEWLQRLGSTDVWFKSFEVPASTRLSYQLAPDVPQLPGSEGERRMALLATAQADPLNRAPWPAEAPDRFSRHSTVSLERAPVQPGLDGVAAAAGSLQRFELASGLLGNRREISIYRPPGFDPQRADKLLLFVFDADEYLSKVPTPLILDRLQAAGRLPPVVAVFVANPDRAARSRELPANPQFADFMADELLPRVLAETGLVADPARTILAGSSYGGLAAATVALRRPQQFGNVLSLSGSFWWPGPPQPQVMWPERPHHVANLVLAEPAKLPLRFFLAAGLFEGARPGSDGILETNRHLRDVLQARGYPVIAREYAAGHDYLVWRGALADGLLALFGTPTSP